MKSKSVASDFRESYLCTSDATSTTSVTTSTSSDATSITSVATSTSSDLTSTTGDATSAATASQANFTLTGFAAYKC